VLMCLVANLVGSVLIGAPHLEKAHGPIFRGDHHLRGLQKLVKPLRWVI
jgi:hypothetical protein